MQAAGVANLNYNWSVAGVAVAKQIMPGSPGTAGTLTLTRAQGNGPMTVTLVLDNGGGLVPRRRPSRPTTRERRLGATHAGGHRKTGDRSVLRA